MSHVKRASLAAFAMVLVAAAGAAQAQDDGYRLPGWYVGPLVGYMAPDSVRDADAGYNAQIVLGKVLAEAVAIELNAFGTELARESESDFNDYVYGGGLDLTLGVPAPGNPLFTIGGGVVEQDIAQEKKQSTYGEVGLGVYLPFSLAGELWRLEGRYHLVFNDHPDVSVADEELLEDGRINFGFLFTFDHETLPRDEEPVGATATEPPPPPVSDSDQDGVADAQDQCPDTPAWVRPDSAGCTPDTDGDGVDESRDRCPETPAGLQVDAHGCDASVAPKAAPADEDRDGVLDDEDACPHTSRRLDVDDKGCLRPEDATMKNVHFDINSARLTADGYALLHALSATLKSQPDLRLEIGGHADSTGSAKTNLALAAERAKVVFYFLTYTGIPESRFTVKSYGEASPVADNKDVEGRAKNRRVTFKRLN